MSLNVKHDSNVIDILDQSSDTVIKFFKQNDRHIFTNDKVLLSLLNLKWSRKKREKLICLAWIIVSRLGDQDYKKKYCDFLSIYKYFQEYIYSCCHFFGNKRIPWEEWEDLAKEQDEVLKILVAKGQLKSFRRTKNYQEFLKKYRKRLVLFEEKGYLHECDFDVPSGI